MDGNGCARYLDSLDTDAISDPKWIEMASSHVQLQVYPSLCPSYFEPMVRSGFVPAFFGTADSWSLTSLCGFGIAEDEVSVKAGVATHLRFPNPLAPVSDTSPKKYIGSIHLGVPLRYDRGIRLISIAPSIL